MRSAQSQEVRDDIVAQDNYLSRALPLSRDDRKEVEQDVTDSLLRRRAALTFREDSGQLIVEKESLTRAPLSRNIW